MDKNSLLHPQALQELVTPPKPEIMNSSGWLIWGLSAYFFFLHYFLRVAPASLLPDLVIDLQIHHATFLGVMGAWFYYPYILMQLPSGYLIDKYSVKFVLTLAILISGFSALLFAQSTCLEMINLSRFLLGIGSASGFICTIKLAAVWFHPRHLPFFVGLTQAVGMFGAFASLTTLNVWVDFIGWRQTLFGAGICCFILAILVLSFVKNNPPSLVPTKIYKPKGNIFLVLNHPLTWINALYAGLIFAPILIIGEFWGIGCFQLLHQLSDFQSALVGSFLFIGWAFGSPVSAYAANRLGRKKIMIASSLMGTILLPLLIYYTPLPFFVLLTISFLYGFTNTGLIASYTASSELFSKNQIGLSVGIANMVSLLIGTMLLPVISGLIDYGVHQRMLLSIDTLPTSHWESIDFKFAMAILPICLLLSLVCALLTRETIREKR
jgi:MFS family permease